MSASSYSRSDTAIIFGAALVQGIGLYALHLATRNATIDAPAPAWTGVLLALSVFLPLTVQMLRSHLQLPRTWITLLVLTVLLAGFGWHLHLTNHISTFAASCFLLSLWWLLALPFMQSWTREQRGWPQYSSLFINAWHNHLILAQAIVFCGLFWALLGLGAGLFKLLGIDLPFNVITSPLFRSMFIPLGFALGLQLSSTSPRLTGNLMELVLTPLKWLSLLSGLILLTFTPILMIKLPSMISNGQHIVPASILLWLIAASVLFINAAFRDGQTGAAFPRRIESVLRAVMPFMIVISLTALYALYVRIDAHGLTVSRVWAVLTAVIALLYSVGYTVAAWRSGPWMADIAPANTAIALFMIAALSLMLTPVLSPQRLASNSLLERILQSTGAPEPYDSRLRALANAGSYGRERLQTLAQLQDHPHAEQIRQQATNLLDESRLQWESTEQPADFLAQLPIHPAGQTLSAEDIASLENDLKTSQRQIPGQPVVGGVFVDLDADGEQEFILLHPHGGLVYVRTTKGLAFSTTLHTVGTNNMPGMTPRVLEEDAVRLLRPRWLMLEVGGYLLRDFDSETRERPAAPTPDDSGNGSGDDSGNDTKNDRSHPGE